MCRSWVAIPGGLRLRRHIGLQGGDKCQPKPIKISQPLFWLSDLVPPSQHSRPGAQTVRSEWRRLVQSRDPNFGVEIPDLKERLLVWGRDPETEQTSRSRDPEISSSPAPRLCSNDWQNHTSSHRASSTSSEERASANPKGRISTSPSC